MLLIVTLCTLYIVTRCYDLILPAKLGLSCSAKVDLTISSAARLLHSCLDHRHRILQLYGKTYALTKGDSLDCSKPPLVARQMDYRAVNANALDGYGGKTNIAFCQACGKAFIKRGNRQKYCGPLECQSVRNKIKSKEYYYR